MVLSAKPETMQEIRKRLVQSHEEEFDAALKELPIETLRLAHQSNALAESGDRFHLLAQHLEELDRKEAQQRFEAQIDAATKSADAATQSAGAAKWAALAAIALVVLGALQLCNGT